MTYIVHSTYERFSLALHNTARTWRFSLDRRLKRLGLSQAAWMTIAMIAKAKTPLSQSELAQLTGVENPTMVAMIDRLVKAGYVERQPSPSDRRVRLVILTASGQAIYQELRKEAELFREELLRDHDPVVLDNITQALEAIQKTAEELK